MDSKAITAPEREILPRALTVGQVANQVAARHVFEKYRRKKAKNTLIRHGNDLALFGQYLADVGAAPPGELGEEPAAWSGVTWGLLEGFQEWQLKQGFAVGSVNVRLSTVKSYAKLAMKAGSLAAGEYALIQTVTGYSRQDGRNIDQARAEAGIPTRFPRPGAKKAAPVSVTPDQARQLQRQPKTPQGRRDALLMSLLIEHGLRCGEVALLEVGHFNLKTGELKFFRPKVAKEQTHRLAANTLKAARAYFNRDALAAGPLLRSSTKSGELAGAGMTERAITFRVKTLGERIGIEGLSAHDLRHYAATRLAKTKDVKELMEIFGWSSPAMAVRYIEDAKVIEVE